MRSGPVMLATMLGLGVAIAAGRADVTIGDSTIGFATAETGKKLLTQSDDFTKAMSPFDRAARLKTDKDVTEKQLLEFVGQNVTEWPEGDKAKVQAALEAIKPALAELKLPFPNAVQLIRTTGNEEGGAAYTRGTAIVLPPGELREGVAALQGTIAHELFHVLSRAHPDLREKAYAAIGFVKCDEVELPADLKARKITNPDAPHNNHCIQLKVGGQNVWAIPILVSSTATYNTVRGGEFFQYLSFKWLLVTRGDEGKVQAALKDGQPQLLDMGAVGNFYEQVGRNTTYTLHPEEILADNFKLLVTRGAVPSADVMTKFKAALQPVAPAPVK